ncbi:MAG: hypothetical protein ACJ762_05110 [Solirubrobacteraceae bacterium]
MAPPAGPIYASTLHRRDRGWQPRRRRARMRLLRGAVWSSATAAIAALLIAHFA